MSCRIDRVVTAERQRILRNCPPYIREWVTRERAERTERPWEQGLEGREDREDA